MSYYVTSYSFYPIYEPAEGGYYYPGVQVKYSYKCQTWNKAKRVLRKLYKECILDGSVNERGWFESSSKQHFGWNGKHVGEGWYIKLERRQGEDISGWHPYE